LWALYSAALLLFYLFETNPLIRGFCPLLIIPLATAVAMFEGDLAAGIFGAVCGLMLDMANGVTVLGFSGLWLVCLCPAITLLSRFWVRVSALSHFVMNAAATVIMAFMDMIFLHWVWERSQSVISLRSAVLPSYGGAILFSIPIFYLVRLISVKMRPAQQQKLENSANNAEESASKEKD
ncbi:MAG: hypothetical protein ACI4JS_00800, partial [Oscillospiraceae bacterium]